MTQDNVHIVRHFYDALSAGDLGSLFDRFAPSIDWREAEGFPYADGNPYTTPQAVADGVLRRIAEDWDGFRVGVEAYVGDGDTVVMLGGYSGTYRATGKRMAVPVAHVWRVEDGQVVAFRQYVDTLLVQRATVASFAHPMRWPSTAGP